MEVTINQQKHVFTNDVNLQQVIAYLYPSPPKGIAVAVNQEIITKSHWPSHALQPNDHITIITATQGG